MPHQETSQEVILGREYLHKSKNGLRYKTESFILDATGYEVAHTVRKSVIYEQLEEGSYPAGTKWVRDSEDFLSNFDIIENE